MAEWNHNRPQGAAPPPDPWQEMPGYQPSSDQGAGSWDWDGPTDRPPPPGPQVPLEKLGRWLEYAWTLYAANWREYMIMQLLALGLSLGSFGVLAGPMLAGYYRYALKRTRGEPADYNDLFSGLSGSYRQTVLPGLALAWSAAGAFCVLAVIDLIASQIPWAVLAVVIKATLDLAGLVVIAAGVGVFSLMLPLIHERGQTPMAAWETCLKLFRANWAKAGIFGGVVGGGLVIGLLVLGVGVLVGGPLGILVGAQGFRVLFASGAGAAPFK